MARWSLGVFGDHLWRLFPELRPAVKELICDSVQLRIDLDEDLQQLELSDFVVHVVGPHAVRAMEEDRDDASVAPRMAELIRATLAYDGPGSATLHDTLALYLLEALAAERSVDKLAAVDPGLVAEVRRRWPGTWGD